MPALERRWWGRPRSTLTRRSQTFRGNFAASDHLPNPRKSRIALSWGRNQLEKEKCSIRSPMEISFQPRHLMMFDAFASAWCTQHLDSLAKFLNCEEPYTSLHGLENNVNVTLCFCEPFNLLWGCGHILLFPCDVSHFHDFLMMPTAAGLPERNHAKRLRRTDRRIQPTRPSFSWYLKSWCKTDFHMRMFGNYWSSGKISCSQHNQFLQ